MNRDRATSLLADVAAGRIQVEDALAAFSDAPIEDLGFATIDHHRALRQGFPEVIFGGGKTPEQVVEIAARVASRGDGVLVTRLSPDAGEAVRAAFPGVAIDAVARTAVLQPSHPSPRAARSVLIVTAGTSDLPVASEAAVTADVMRCEVVRLNDVGVAGLHRLLSSREVLEQSGVIIVVAGMDGALASVVGGLARVPVIAVPTSIGYGAAFGGVAPLLSMLNSCAAGVTVVNIDNGFGAAMAAARILHS